MEYPPLSEEAKSVETGTYEHYKGSKYQVLGVCYHSETLEELVVYQKVKDKSLWVRPVKMFKETVLINSQSVSRFRKI